MARGAARPTAAGMVSGTRPSQLLTRRSALLLAALTLPLGLLIVGLAVVQFHRERSGLLADLAFQAREHRFGIESSLAPAASHVARMRSFFEERVAEAGGRGSSPGRARLRLTTIPTPAGSMTAYTLDHLLGADAAKATGNLIGTGRRLAEPGAYDEIDAALDAFELMRLEHAVTPFLRWSYFLPAAGDFLAIYPLAPAGELMATETGQGIGDLSELVERWLAFDVFQLGRPERNPERRPYWTEIYLDAGGAGWMVSHAAPVDADGRFLGVVGTDILLSAFGQLLDRLSWNVGQLALVNRRGQVLAARSEGGAASVRIGGIGDLMPSLRERPTDELLAPRAQFERVGDRWLLALPIENSPFALLYGISESRLSALLLPRFAPYALILVGLLGTFVASVWTLRRLLIAPGEALVRYIEAEAGGQATAPPSLPAPWRPWRVAVSEAFAANRAYQERLESSEARYRAVIEDQTEAVARYDSDFKLVFCNRANAAIFGCAPEDAIGADLFQGMPAPLCHELRAALLALTPDNPIHRGENDKLLPSGETRLFAFSNRALFDEAGRKLGYQSVGRDITDQRAAATALARQREALHQSEKLAALGSLLAGVAHELNNPLSIVVGYSGMLRELAPDEGTRGRAEQVHMAAERCARIVKTFLAMARAKPARRGPVSLPDILKGVLELAAYGLRTGSIEVVREDVPDLPMIMGDADQLPQVFMNLVINAQQALLQVRGPRRLTIATSRQAQEVCVRIADNGPGMSEEVRRRIFEPFFTTKPQGVGTGIGLSVCHGIVDAHGGRLEVKSSPEAGTEFRVFLPVVAGRAAPEGKTALLPPQALVGRVLVVDDEGEIAELVAATLRRDGLAVSVASSGASALKLLAARRFHLAISDLRMPDLDGTALIEAIEQRRPELRGRIIVMTGDALGAELDALVRDRNLPIFEKPLDLEQLRRTVGELLQLERPPAGNGNGRRPAPRPDKGQAA